MDKRTSFPGTKQEDKGKEWGTIIDDLFHQFRSFVVSLEGYTEILSHEYSGKLDRKGKHYISRIRKNVKEIERVARMLREYVNDKDEDN